MVLPLDSSFISMIQDQELDQLGKSEHPLLRAIAFRIMQNRKTIPYLERLKSHLDDTAIVAIDNGEFGISFQTVSDDILQEMLWATRQDRDRIAELVILRHNYLQSAYTVLPNIPLQDKFYPFIKDMATRPRRIGYDGRELDFDDIEYALYGLARFQKKEDIPVIKEKLMQHAGRLSFVSFAFMKQYPDTAFMDVLEAYHRKRFYRSRGYSRNGFSGFPTDPADPEDFINALLAQESERSARLLDTMLQLLPTSTRLPNARQVQKDLIMAIWDHPCPAYAQLREKLKPSMKANKAEIVQIEVDGAYIPADAVAGPIKWKY